MREDDRSDTPPPAERSAPGGHAPPSRSGTLDDRFPPTPPANGHGQGRFAAAGRRLTDGDPVDGDGQGELEQGGGTPQRGQLWQRAWAAARAAAPSRAGRGAATGAATAPRPRGTRRALSVVPPPAAHDAGRADGSGRGNGAPPGTDPGATLPPPRRPRLKKLRLASILAAMLVLGLISFVFGMFMAVASQLPQLENRAEFNNASNSRLIDFRGRAMATLARQNKILLTPHQIPAVVKEAVIAIEDKRFFHNGGIDVRGIARALVADLLRKRAVQGASTIEQQFVKNVLQAQAHRTIFEKLREAALAYHLSREWPKDKIITQYLNTVYFGNGAYGIESAAETYFGRSANAQGCGPLKNQQPCVSKLADSPWEAALLAGMVASPSGYDPVTHPAAALARRNLVLRNMLQQGFIDRLEYQQSIAQPLPPPSQILPPQLTSPGNPGIGFFDNWVQQQVTQRYGVNRAYEGGLLIHTSLDLDLQRAAQAAINNYLGGSTGPTAAMVAIDNATGQVRAMVGGPDYSHSPFNLATTGERQPGSAFKAFDLAAALERGISPYSVWSSRLKIFPQPGGGQFVVHNDEGSYTGSNTLIGATADSDNSIFAEVGIKAVGTKRIARVAHRLGITTPISTNYAMTIGGLTTGVTVLDMAHAYETIAQGGRRVGGTLVGKGQPKDLPTGIVDVRLPNGHVERNQPHYERVMPASVASTETSMLETVVTSGTGTAASIGGFAAGKTGTTSNYGDAWFVGWNNQYTVAVWVGYPDRLVPMTTAFNGKPVLGGTFPALIWHDFMLSAMQIAQNRAAQNQGATGQSGATGSSTVPPAATGPGTTSTPPPAGGAGSTPTPRSPNAPGAPSTPATPPSRSPAPAPSTPSPGAGPPAGGGGNGGGAAAPTGGAAAH